MAKEKEKAQNLGEENNGDVSTEGAKTKPSQNEPVFLEDKGFYRLVIRFLGWIAILGVVGSIGLAAFETDIPQGVIALSSTAIGAMAGVLTIGKVIGK